MISCWATVTRSGLSASMEAEGKERAMSEQLVEGAVVRWTGGDGIGVIRRIASGQVFKVEMGLAERAHAEVSSAEKNAPLVRAVLPSRVYRQSTDQPGILGALVSEDPPKWKVTVLGPTALPREGRSGRLNCDRIMRLTLRPEWSMARSVRHGSSTCSSSPASTGRSICTNDLVSLGDARVDVKPHQVGVVHRVVTSYPHRFLLCDEVGLGKTIEAGMVLKELRSESKPIAPSSSSS